MRAPLAVLALTLLGCGAPAITKTDQCISCHDSAAASWSGSGHANAAASSVFNALLPRVEARWGAQERRRCESCHEQVTCASCHLAVGNNEEANRALVIDETATVATGGEPSGRAPHRTVKRSFFRSASLCGTCHEVRTPHLVEETLTEYRTSSQASEDSCASCHFDGHEFRGASGALLAKALRLEVSRSEVRLTNVGAAHSVPTGQIGLREVWVDVTVTDQDGVVRQFPRALDLTADLGGVDVFTDANAIVFRGLPAGEARAFQLADGAERVTARLFFRGVRESTSRALNLQPTPPELVAESTSQ